MQARPVLYRGEGIGLIATIDPGTDQTVRMVDADGVVFVEHLVHAREKEAQCPASVHLACIHLGRIEQRIVPRLPLGGRAAGRRTHDVVAQQRRSIGKYVLIRQADLQISIELQTELATACPQHLVLFVYQHLVKGVGLELPLVFARQLVPARLRGLGPPRGRIPQIAVRVWLACPPPRAKALTPMQFAQDFIEAISLEPARVPPPEAVEPLDHVARSQPLEPRERLAKRLALRGEGIGIRHPVGPTMPGHTLRERRQGFRGQKGAASARLGQLPERDGQHVPRKSSHRTAMDCCPRSGLAVRVAHR